MEVNAAECGEQRTEHHHREYGIDHLAQRLSCGIQLRYPVEDEIDQRSRGYRHWQRPVFQELFHIHAAKLKKNNHG